MKFLLILRETTPCDTLIEPSSTFWDTLMISSVLPDFWDFEDYDHISQSFSFVCQHFQTPFPPGRPSRATYQLFSLSIGDAEMDPDTLGPRLALIQEGSSAPSLALLRSLPRVRIPLSWPYHCSGVPTHPFLLRVYPVNAAAAAAAGLLMSEAATLGDQQAVATASQARTAHNAHPGARPGI